MAFCHVPEMNHFLFVESKDSFFIVELLKISFIYYGKRQCSDAI